MSLSPRAKLLLIMLGFALPILLSFVVYYFARPEATGNYGELLAPKPVTEHVLGVPGGGSFRFTELRGRWVLTASDSGACGPVCLDKLALMRQVRLALGRNAARVARVFVVDDLRAPDPRALAPFEGTVVALTLPGMTLPLGAGNDRAHVYLVDPQGRVMMRWPAAADGKRMLRDLNRLLKASQIG